MEGRFPPPIPTPLDSYAWVRIITHNCAACAGPCLPRPFGTETEAQGSSLHPASTPVAGPSAAVETLEKTKLSPRKKTSQSDGDSGKDWERPKKAQSERGHSPKGHQTKKTSKRRHSSDREKSRDSSSKKVHPSTSEGSKPKDLDSSSARPLPPASRSPSPVAGPLSVVPKPSVFQGATTTVPTLLYDEPRPVLNSESEGELHDDVPVSNAERFSLMSPDLQDDLRITMSRLEDASTEYASNACSDLVLQLNQEESKTAVQQDGGVMTYLQCFGVVPDRVLKMVYEESYKILVLSDKSQTSYDKEKAPSVEGWQRERLTLLDTVQSLKDYLSKVPDKENKENASSFFDWRGELLQSVQCVLEKERIMFQSYLQSQFHNPGSGDEGTLIEKLEHIMEQQEQQQKIVLEHLLSSDRNSLLTEIQDLEAQLRLMHLESQEKLQQLQEMLINTENHGSNQEHQLRRQVELLEYKLQQEKSIASDLQASLKREQEKASEVHELLKQEHTVIFNLKSDLCESKQVNERLQKSLQELQKEVVKYR
ncbi:hypothetical protein JD844_023381 [Phrynosoma platyrhinos]|uniref:Uncharacterized protein n=1 Tax=Phrynosoma platyrhinos TaxID=52577 RepID=A0ABQ7SWF2_PHRPL|nr:hypothetical protein JD844_023381 [Phrynosoma platyrhinos]